MPFRLGQGPSQVTCGRVKEQEVPYRDLPLCFNHASLFESLVNRCSPVGDGHLLLRLVIERDCVVGLDSPVDILRQHTCA